MSSDHQQRALAAYEGLYSLPEQDRSSFLSELQHRDAAAFDELVSLIRHNERASALEFLAHSVANVTLEFTSTMPVRVGPYRIVREIGRGGMGVVYEAVQVEPAINKSVALKVLAFHSLADSALRDRFLREAQLAAELHHTNIVPVLFAGSHDGTLYYVMQLIVGTSLEHAVRRHSSDTPGHNTERSTASTFDLIESTDRLSRELCGPLPVPGIAVSQIHSPPYDTHEYYVWVAKVAIQAAEALAYAHERNIVHRDIKPSNLILDNHGTLWVADFGLARRLDAPDVSRASGIMGSPRYMSPEQASGRAVDHRTDIYSLGVSVYELTTLTPMIENDTVGQILRAIENQEPVRPRERISAIPRDLETIILKSIAKPPADRYQRAEDMATDLRLWLESRPILARRVGPVGRVVRWCQREPKVAVAVACMLLGFVLSIWQWRQAVVARNAATQSAELARYEKQNAQDSAQGEADARQSAEKELYRSLLNDSRSLRLTRRQGWRETALQNLVQANTLSARSASQVRSEAIACAGGIDVTSLGSLSGHSGNFGVVWSMAFSPDGQKLASVDEAGNSWLWDVAAMRQLQHRSVPTPSPAPHAVRFHPGGEHSFFSSRPKAIDVMSFSAPRTKLPELDIPGHIVSIAFNHDGRVMAIGCKEGIAAVFDLEQGTLLRKVPVEANFFAPVSLSPDGSTLAVVAEGHTLQLISVNNDSPPVTLGKHRKIIRSVAFSPDGTQIAAGSEDMTATLWDVADRQESARLLGHTATINTVAFNADASLVATASDDTSVRLWDARRGDLVLVLEPRIGPITSLAFSPDSTKLAIAFKQINIYEIAGIAAKRELMDRGDQAKTVSFRPSEPVIVAGIGSRVTFWDSKTGQNIADWTHKVDKAVSCLSVSPNGKVAVVGFEGYRNIPSKRFGPHLFPLDSGQQWRPLRGASADTRSVAFDSTGDWITAVLNDGSCLLWNLINDEPQARWTADSKIMAAVLADQGRRVIYADASGNIVVRDVRESMISAQQSLGTAVLQLAISRDEMLLAAGCADGTIAIIQVPDLTVAATFSKAHAGDITALTFGGTGRLLASGSIDRHVALWDLESNQQVCALPVEHNSITGLAFDDDCSKLAICGASRRISIWDLTSISEDLKQIDPEWQIAGIPSRAARRQASTTPLPPNPFKATASPDVDAQQVALHRLSQLEASEQWNELIAAAEESLKRFPKLKEAHNAMGRGQHELGNQLEAVAAFQKHLGLCPNCPAALFGMARCYLQMGDLDSAVNCLQPFAQRRDPDLSQANNYTDIMLNARRFVEVDRYLHQIESPKVSRVWISGRLAYTSSLAGQPEHTQAFLHEAKEHLLKSMDRSNSDQEAEFLQAFEMLCLGRHDAAFDVVNKLVTTHPNDPNMLVQAARLFGASLAHTPITVDPSERRTLRARHKERAIELLTAALAAGFPANKLRDQPDFELIRNDRRFQTLLK